MAPGWCLTFKNNLNLSIYLLKYVIRFVSYSQTHNVDGILDMGFLDCMRKFNPEPVQTHRNARSKFPWELDHMFATENLYERLTDIHTVEVLELSDHDPIVADFK